VGRVQYIKMNEKVHELQREVPVSVRAPPYAAHGLPAGHHGTCDAIRRRRLLRVQVVELRQQSAERLDMTNFQEKASSRRRRSRPSGYPAGPLVPLPLTPCRVPQPPRTPHFLLPLPRDPLSCAGQCRVLRT
jgi:hypothetical protein